ncbi:MAG: acyl carrier protein [Betaproteobacteria bacterium]
MARVEDVVRDFIVINFLFGETDRKLSDDDSLLELGIIDSTGILELVFFLEATYAIQIREQEMVPANLDSISKVANFISRKLAAAR